MAESSGYFKLGRPSGGPASSMRRAFIIQEPRVETMPRCLNISPPLHSTPRRLAASMEISAWVWIPTRYTYAEHVTLLYIYTTLSSLTNNLL